MTGAAVPDDVCLCGSAGVWHTLSIPADTPSAWQTVASESTQAVHAGKREQVPEWLGRLFHAPATLPPYSLMVSSIGVAPLAEQYGQQVKVEQLRFFGGALTDQRSKNTSGDFHHPVATMVHVVTFRGELHGMLNFTSPGVSKAFAQELANGIKEHLQSVANKHAA